MDGNVPVTKPLKPLTPKEPLEMVVADLSEAVRNSEARMMVLENENIRLVGEKARLQRRSAIKVSGLLLAGIVLFSTNVMSWVSGYARAQAERVSPDIDVTDGQQPFVGNRPNTYRGSGCSIVIPGVTPRSTRTSPHYGSLSGSGESKTPNSGVDLTPEPSKTRNGSGGTSVGIPEIQEKAGE